jgi:CHASE1-domain containing sensor protein
MTPNDWAALAVAITTLIGTLAVAVRHLVKHYLSELRPNGGSSVKDQVNRLEQKVDSLYQILIQNGRQ